MRKTQKILNGFTLMEILLVATAISILAGIVVVAINPAKQLGEVRNAQRRSDVNTILNAVYQYAVDNKGALPANITTSTKEICAAGVAQVTCSVDGLVYLEELTVNEKYLVSLPMEPDASKRAANGTGYNILKTAGNRVTVSAPGVEQGASISATR